MSGLFDTKVYPLTAKWTRMVHGFSFRSKISYQECLQEALILEWNMNKKEISDLIHRENYFKLALYRRLGALLPVQKFRRGVLISDLFKDSENELGGRRSEEDMFDMLVQLRSFDEIFYQDLVIHTANVLRDLNEVTCSMFMDKIKHNCTWAQLKEVHYSKIPHSKFYKNVHFIKKVTRNEICNGTLIKDEDRRHREMQRKRRLRIALEKKVDSEEQELDHALEREYAEILGDIQHKIGVLEESQKAEV